MAQTSRATESKLSALHSLTADVLTSQIDAYLAGSMFSVDKDGNQVPLSIPPALLAQAIKFLKDNGVDAPARDGNRVDRLAKTLERLKDTGDDDE